MSNIVFNDVHVYYESKRSGLVQALDHLNICFDDEKINVLIGYSGSGKTTILNCLSGKLIFNGEILIDGINIDKIDIKNRNIAYVNQEFILYPHLTIYDNIAFPLKNMKLPREEINKRIYEVTKALEIDYLLTRKPKNLSIGQQQRVAIARAVVKKPSILLLDEPFSALDKITRENIRELLKRFIKDNKITCIFVSHNISDALYLGDNISIIHEGKLLAKLTPNELLDSEDEIIKTLLTDIPHEEKESRLD